MNTFEDKLKNSLKGMVEKSKKFVDEKPEIIDTALNSVTKTVLEESKVVYMVIMMIAYESIEKHEESLPQIYQFLDMIKMGCFPTLETFRKLDLNDATKETINKIIKDYKEPDKINQIIFLIMKTKITEPGYGDKDVSEAFTTVMNRLKELNSLKSEELVITKWNIPEDIKGIIKKQYPTDLVIFKETMLRKLSSYWIKDKDFIDDENFTVPADLLWSDTIPVKDMVIQLDKEAKITDTDNFRTIDTKSIRFIYYQRPEENNWEKCICLLAVVLMADGTEFVVPFKVSDDKSVDNDHFGNIIEMIPTIGLLKSNQTWYKNYFKENTELHLLEDICDFASVYVPVWYGIQVGLLNPSIELVFKNNTVPKHAIVETTKDRKGKAKNKIRYVKKIVITDDVFEECIEHSYIRTKLCWYVTGHWRNQATKDGHKRIFIQGYWKGIARDTKVADIRERDIVLRGDTNDNK